MNNILPKDVSIGVFYETSNGKIAYTYGYNGKENPDNPTISYYFDDDSGPHSIKLKDMQDWKLRRDLKDYPNARDPRLPYSFDLHWDIKHQSELRQMLKWGQGDKDLFDLMLKYDLCADLIPKSHTKGKNMKVELLRVREQIQDDLIALLDSGWFIHQDIIDDITTQACDIVVKNFKELNDYD